MQANTENLLWNFWEIWRREEVDVFLILIAGGSSFYPFGIQKERVDKPESKSSSAVAQVHWCSAQTSKAPQVSSHTLLTTWLTDTPPDAGRWGEVSLPLLELFIGRAQTDLAWEKVRHEICRFSSALGYKAE